jgi:hypothetical protein
VEIGVTVCSRSAEVLARKSPADGIYTPSMSCTPADRAASLMLATPPLRVTAERVRRLSIPLAGPNPQASERVATSESGRDPDQRR